LLSKFAEHLGLTAEDAELKAANFLA